MPNEINNNTGWQPLCLRITILKSEKIPNPAKIIKKKNFPVSELISKMKSTRLMCGTSNFLQSGRDPNLNPNLSYTQSVTLGKSFTLCFSFLTCKMSLKISVSQDGCKDSVKWMNLAASRYMKNSSSPLHCFSKYAGADVFCFHFCGCCLVFQQGVKDGWWLL